ncbi:MAG: GTP-binding protein, partial [Eubacterium sp.]|nr:GTP-binding protein [Eubacterium sp.]
MTKIDIISGFLGAGKTTLIKKLIEEAFADEQVVLIENEFGEIGIDSGFLKESGIQINEMNSGCICCSLVGDFKTALGEVLDQFHPDRIVIEPSGVGKLSDVMSAVSNVVSEDVALNSHVTVSDAKRAKTYIKNFGEFYKNQIEYASAIILSRTQDMKEDKLEKTIELLRDLNDKSPIVTTPWDQLTGKQLLEVIEGKNSFEEEMIAAAQAAAEAHAKEHEHHHHDHEEEHEHHHHHDHEEEHEHHHHHDHEEEHEHHHHHDHEEEHEHHHHHDHEEHEHHHHHDHGHDHHHHHH